MSDNLADLPIDEDEDSLSTEQKQTLKKYLGASKSSDGKSKWTDTSKWKIIGAAAVAFLIFSNPYMIDLLDKVPVLGGNSMTVMLLAAALFILAMTCIVMFL